MDEPEKVLEILQVQKKSIRENVEKLQFAEIAIDVLENEIKNSNIVNFAEYAKIISGVNDSWANIWSFKLMESDLRTHIIKRFDSKAGLEFNKKLMGIIDKIIEARENNIQPTSPEGEKLLSLFWESVSNFLDGNMDLLPSLQAFESNLDGHSGEFAIKWKQAVPFINGAKHMLDVEGVDL